VGITVSHGYSGFPAHYPLNYRFNYFFLLEYKVVRIFNVARLLALGLFLFASLFAASQEQADRLSRGSIPEELLRPKKGEAPRYPIDTVIGELGKGTASDSAFSYANYVSSGFLSGKMDNPALVSVNSSLRESFLSALEVIAPVSFRLGGGREEADGAISFLIRFIGREQGITGELYIRYITRQSQGADGEVKTSGNWIFEEMLLEEARNHEVEQQESMYLHDFYPYERFF
jgi:hypothetical protein